MFTLIKQNEDDTSSNESGGDHDTTIELCVEPSTSKSKLTDKKHIQEYVYDCTSIYLRILTVLCGLGIVIGLGIAVYYMIF